MRPAETPPSAERELHHFLGRALAWLEGTTLAALLLLALAAPATGRAGVSLWALLLLYAGYNLLLELLRRRLPRRRAFAWKYLLGLPGVALVYALGPGPGGLLFVLFFLAVVCAVASLPPRRGALYTAMGAALVGGLDLTFLPRPPPPAALRELGARLVVLAVFGAGTAILTQRLARQHEATRLIRDKAGQLAERDRVRTGFLLTVSHDLRTPLTAARTALRAVETSAADRLRADERALLDNGRRNIERLDRLIADLLDLSRLEAGALRLEREPIDLRGVIRDALSTVEPLIRDKGQALTVELPEPLHIEGDPRRLGQVVVNLLANAHRHTPAGTRIAIGGQSAGDEVRLTVRDDGPGFPPADAPDRGAGLGLAIARGFVELHGGRLWAESGPGRGAAFHVALPRYQEGEVG